MIAAAAQHGTTIGGLLLVLAVVLAGATAFYFAPELIRAQAWWAGRHDRRSIRRCRRESVRAVRGLGAQLLADEAKLRESGGAR